MSPARDPEFAAALRALVKGEVRENERLGRHATYRIGGNATLLLPASGEDVSAALKLCGEREVPWFVLGLGSNLLLPDQGMDALVIRIGKGLDQISNEGRLWKLGAGMPQPLAARRTSSAGYGGIHRMVGVPGSVGGGIRMNAGCHGSEWQDTVLSVLVADQHGERVIPASAAGFAYRQSALGDVVVLGTTVELFETDKVELEAEVERIHRWRRAETPFNLPCCGSVFKNPPQVESEEPRPRTSGQYLDSVGLKGFQIGGVQVSPMHANYFINLGEGTAEDVKALMREARRQVADRWGVILEPEVKLINPAGGIASLDS